MTIGTTTIDYTLPGGCNSSVTLSVYAPPAVFTITGGGFYCAGDSGVHIGLSGSEVGVIYLLYHGSTPAGTFTGTGAPLDFGWQSLPGSYIVKATGTISGCTTDMSGTVVVGVLPVVVPSVTINSTPGDTICSGTLVSFTPVPVNGGSTPLYHWYVNGINVSASTSYSYLPVAGDTVMVKLTSSAVCPAPDTAIHKVAMTVHASAAPLINITASPGDTVCKGSILTVTESTTFGGTAPVYTWIKNGVSVGSGTLYTEIPVNNDVIYCVLQSNYPCRLYNTDTSNQITVKVDTPTTPVITILTTPGNIVSPGTPVTFTASTTNGGYSPTWQWYMNGVLIPGATSNIYTIDTLHSPQLDSFTCHVTSSGPCIMSGTQLVYLSVVSEGVGNLSVYSSDIQVAPNPAKGELVISGYISSSILNSTDEKVGIVITDLSGRAIYQSTTTAANGKLNERIHLSGVVQNGTYLLTIKTVFENKIFRLVIEQ